MSGLLRRAHDALLPSGIAWNTAKGGGMDQFFEGVTEAFEDAKDDMTALASARDPLTTPFLEELELEYGIVTDETKTEAQRRANLAAKDSNRKLSGQLFALQNALDAAGFNLTVYANDPAVDPATFLNEIITTYCGGDGSYCGGDLAYCGGYPSGEMVVNGDIYNTTLDYTAYCGATTTYCGGDSAYCGAHDGVIRTLFTYPVPTASASWPLVFFVGGAATFNPNGSLLTLARGSVPSAKRLELIEIIVRIKPEFTWCALVVAFT